MLKNTRIENKISLKKLLKDTLKDNNDSKFQTLNLNNSKVELIYIKTLCDTTKIQELLIKSFFELENVDKFEAYVKSLEGFTVYKNDRDIVNKLYDGHVVIYTATNVLLIQVRNYENLGVLQATTESTIQGPQSALSEDLIINLNLIRHRYHKTSLMNESLNPVGTTNQIKIEILYDQSIVDNNLVKKVKEKISTIDKDVIQGVGEVQNEIKKGKALFPTYMVTERPDRIAYNLSKGKVIILLEGSPFALIVPAVFFDFMSSMEDLYQTFWISKFLIILRYIGLFISISLPALYVAITAFNPELFRVQLALSIAGSRIAVPYPAYLEVLFMLVIMEMLIESSIRLPKTIGPTATTVGGLILGQASTDAGLVSNIMIIIVAAVAISNFVIPLNEMGSAIRVLKYILLLVATSFGTIGVVVGLLGILLYLIHLDSFDEPFLRITGSEK
ncbi:spore germination protein [Paraliobacillus quinghaiensis]|uniref:Spore germination protein n=1 Tax=Paraliobacillus quinghaiensis TaxID=470815 RepID=A0A917WRQ2_9BACI|nr:spore germination protein [Paraliobacillus quinghaiensis]GGM23793.1 spore germination protein [Paraliobacillus quinghaiensis]